MTPILFANLFEGEKLKEKEKEVKEIYDALTATPDFFLRVGSLSFDNRYGRITVETAEELSVPEGSIAVLQVIPEIAKLALIPGTTTVIGDFSGKLTVHFSNIGNISCGERISYTKETGSLGTSITTEKKDSYCKRGATLIEKGTPIFKYKIIKSGE